MELKNIRKLLRLAVVNDRLTEQQSKFFKKGFCREKKQLKSEKSIL